MENLVNKNQIELQDPKLTAEEKLWRAVMATAVYDALHAPNVTKKGKYKVFTELTDIQEARNWFQTKEGSFETVCEALNMDADRVHKIMGSKIRQQQFQERLERL